MKVIICALGHQEDIKNAFMKVADVVYWNWVKHSGSFDACLKYLVDQHQPDLVFMQIQTPGIMSEETARYVGSKCMVVNWTGDVRHPTPPWFIEIGRHIHATLFTNMHDVEVCRAEGIRAEYLQIGFPDGIFHPEVKAQQNVPEIVFMGNNIGGFPLSQLRSDMVLKLKKRYGDRFGYYGINWGSSIPSIADQHVEAGYYTAAKIAINLSHFDYSRYSSDRLFRIMGAGCFCLTHAYKDFHKEFQEGVHFDTWVNLDMLIKRIDFYLENFISRNDIAITGCKEVHANHKWDNRIDQLLKML